MVLDSDYRPYFVCLAPFACRVLVHINFPVTSVFNFHEFYSILFLFYAMGYISVVTIPNFAMRYVSRYLFIALVSA